MKQKTGRMGRPPKPKAEKLDKRVVVNMTAAEYKRVKEEARKTGLPLSCIIMRPWREEG